MFQLPWGGASACCTNRGGGLPPQGSFVPLRRTFMNKLVVLLAALWATTAWASVSEIREFAPTPGQTAALYKSAVEAEAIHKKLGASIYIGSDLITGNLVYVLTFPDWGAWADFGTKLQANKDWAAFLAKEDV